MVWGAFCWDEGAGLQSASCHTAEDLRETRDGVAGWQMANGPAAGSGRHRHRLIFPISGFVDRAGSALVVVLWRNQTASGTRLPNALFEKNSALYAMIKRPGKLAKPRKTK